MRPHQATRIRLLRNLYLSRQTDQSCSQLPKTTPTHTTECVARLYAMLCHTRVKGRIRFIFKSLTGTSLTQSRRAEFLTLMSIVGGQFLAFINTRIHLNGLQLSQDPHGKSESQRAFSLCRIGERHTYTALSFWRQCNGGTNQYWEHQPRNRFTRTQKIYRPFSGYIS